MADDGWQVPEAPEATETHATAAEGYWEPTYEEMQNGEPYNAHLADLGVQIPETLTYTGDVHEVRDWIEQTAAHHEVAIDPGLMPTEVDGTLFIEKSMSPTSTWQGTSFVQPGDTLHFDPKEGFSVQVDPARTASIAAEFDQARSKTDHPKWEAGVDRPDGLQTLDDPNLAAERAAVADLPVTVERSGVYRIDAGTDPAEGYQIMDQVERRLSSPSRLPDDRAWTPEEIRARSQQLSAPAVSGPTFDGLPLDHERTLGEKRQVSSARGDRSQFIRSGGATAKAAPNRSAKFRH